MNRLTPNRNRPTQAFESMRRILSIDGGGIKGTFAVSFLSSLEEVLDRPIAEHFDLIAGTSTGGIIALGLGLGIPCSSLLELYENLGPRVFKGHPILRKLRWIGLSKYSPKRLRNELEAHFGDRKLGESRNRLVIPTLNLETGEVHVYKTSHHARLERDFRERAVDVALATAAAPTFFPAHRSTAGVPLIDGGIWANNPVGMAVVEAISVLGWDRESLEVLTVGCTDEPLDIGHGRYLSLGEVYWASRITDLFLRGQSSGSLGTAQLLAGHDRVTRICPVVPNGRFTIDSVFEIESLKGLGASEARKALPRLRATFFQSPAEPFVPFHRHSDT